MENEFNAVTIAEAQARQSEREFKRQIAEALSFDGWHVEREVGTPYGIIDILAIRGREVRLIEAKMSLSGCAVPS